MCEQHCACALRHDCSRIVAYRALHGSLKFSVSGSCHLKQIPGALMACERRHEDCRNKQCRNKQRQDESHAQLGGGYYTHTDMLQCDALRWDRLPETALAGNLMQSLIFTISIFEHH